MKLLRFTRFSIILLIRKHVCILGQLFLFIYFLSVFDGAIKVCFVIKIVHVWIFFVILPYRFQIFDYLQHGIHYNWLFISKMIEFLLQVFHIFCHLFFFNGAVPAHFQQLFSIFTRFQDMSNGHLLPSSIFLHEVLVHFPLAFDQNQEDTINEKHEPDEA